MTGRLSRSGTANGLVIFAAQTGKLVRHAGREDVSCD